MEKRARPAEMSDIEWLVALEEIRQLKARRDRYADAKDWDGYEALHAPDHESHHAPDPTLGGQPPAWKSASEMMDNIRRIMGEMLTVHHSYDPDIIFDTPTKARGIWAMTAGTVSKDANGEQAWNI